MAAAEVAGAGARGAALGFQQTILGIAGIVARIGIAALVSAALWQVTFLIAGLFPVLGWVLVHPLVGRGSEASREAVTYPGEPPVPRRPPKIRANQRGW